MEDKQNIEFLIEKIEDLNSKDLNDFFLIHITIFNDFILFIVNVIFCN